MLTTPEGGAVASAEEDGEASDGNEKEPGKITDSRGRREQAVLPALVWLWRLEEEETEETRQTLNVNPTVKVGTIVLLTKRTPSSILFYIYEENCEENAFVCRPPHRECSPHK